VNGYWGCIYLGEIWPGNFPALRISASIGCLTFYLKEFFKLRFHSATTMILSVSVVLLSCKTAHSKRSALDGANDTVGPQMARFELPLSQLEESLVGAASIDDAATRFATESVRVYAYRLQALGTFYSKQDNLFNVLNEEFEEIENTIGNYAMWTTVIKGAGSSLDKEKRKLFESEKASAFLKIKDLLVKRNWYGPGKLRGVFIREELRKIKWDSPNNDRHLVLDHIKDKLRDMKDTKYQFDSLEKGNGLHELRRDMKWILIDMRVLNGMVLKSPGACPAEAFNKLAADHDLATSKYAVLPKTNVKNPCFVPECLVLGLVKEVEFFGELKDKAELQSKSRDKESDEVSEEIRSQAKERYNFLKKEELIEKTHAAIKSCIQ
jgi:hypothetical protein